MFFHYYFLPKVDFINNIKHTVPFFVNTRGESVKNPFILSVFKNKIREINGRKINVRDMRLLFSSAFYDNKCLTSKQKRECDVLMDHTTKTRELNYIVVDVNRKGKLDPHPEMEYWLEEENENEEAIEEINQGELEAPEELKSKEEEVVVVVESPKDLKHKKFNKSSRKQNKSFSSQQEEEEQPPKKQKSKQQVSTDSEEGYHQGENVAPQEEEQQEINIDLNQVPEEEEEVVPIEIRNDEIPKQVIPKKVSSSKPKKDSSSKSSSSKKTKSSTPKSNSSEKIKSSTPKSNSSEKPKVQEKEMTKKEWEEFLGIPSSDEKDLMIIHSKPRIQIHESYYY